MTLKEIKEIIIRDMKKYHEYQKRFDKQFNEGENKAFSWRMSQEYYHKKMALCELLAEIENKPIAVIILQFIRKENKMFEEEIYGYINNTTQGKKRLCPDCARRLWHEDLEMMVEEGPLTAINESDGDNWFGKICTQCHAKIGPWKECKFCHVLMQDEEPHEMCSELRNNSEALDEIGNGLEETDGWVEEYEEDVVQD